MRLPLPGATLALTLLAASSWPVRIAAAAQTAGPALRAPGGIASSIVDLSNVERRNAGLTALRVSPRLMRAAQLQADQIARARRLDHVLAEAKYRAPADRLAAVGYAWWAYAENLASGQRSASDVVGGWMNSPAHRENILNGTYTEIGVGSAKDASGRTYYVQVFGQPR